GRRGDESVIAQLPSRIFIVMRGMRVFDRARILADFIPPNAVNVVDVVMRVLETRPQSHPIPFLTRRMRGSDRSHCRAFQSDPSAASASLAVHLVCPTVGAELLHLETVGVVPTVLASDVVAVLANLAGQRDLGTNVGGSHEMPSFG